MTSPEIGWFLCGVVVGGVATIVLSAVVLAGRADREARAILDALAARGSSWAAAPRLCQGALAGTRCTRVALPAGFFCRECQASFDQQAQRE
jgi:hypothetical protein